jgi:hypothetical protein
VSTRIRRHAPLTPTIAPPRFEGRIANEIAGYQTREQIVEVQLKSGNERPSLFFPRSSDHPLAFEQRHGISRARHHEILEQIGFFDRGES